MPQKSYDTTDQCEMVLGSLFDDITTDDLSCLLGLTFFARQELVPRIVADLPDHGVITPEDLQQWFDTHDIDDLVDVERFVEWTVPSSSYESDYWCDRVTAAVTDVTGQHLPYEYVGDREAIMHYAWKIALERFINISDTLQNYDEWDLEDTSPTTV